MFERVWKECKHLYFLVRIYCKLTDQIIQNPWVLMFFIGDYGVSLKFTKIDSINEIYGILCRARKRTELG